jgi:tape measure domain-containing protein
MAIAIKTVSDSRKARADLDKLRGSVKGIETSVKSATSSFQSFAVGIGSAIAAATAVSGITTLSDSITDLENKLRATTNTTKEFKSALDNVKRVAISTRTPLAATASLYSKVALSVGKLGVSQKNIGKFTSIVNKSLQLGGASAAEATGAIQQLGQGLAKGRLDGDELRTVLESSAVFAKNLAEGLGVGVGALRDMGATGQLTTKRIFEAMFKQSGEIDKRFSGMVISYGSAFTKLGVAMTVMFSKFSKLLFGTKNTIANAIASLADGIYSLASNLEHTFLIIESKFYNFIFSVMTSVQDLEESLKGLPTRVLAGIVMVISTVSSVLSSIDLENIWSTLVSDFVATVAKIRTAATRLFADMFDGIQGIDLEKIFPGLARALKFVENFTKTAAGFFYTLWDKVVGHSYIPDLVDGVTGHMQRLGGPALAAIRGFAGSAANVFKDLVKTVTSENETLLKSVSTPVNDVEVLDIRGFRAQLDEKASIISHYRKDDRAKALTAEQLKSKDVNDMLTKLRVNAGIEVAFYVGVLSSLGALAAGALSLGGFFTALGTVWLLSTALIAVNTFTNDLVEVADKLGFSYAAESAEKDLGSVIDKIKDVNGAIVGVSSDNVLKGFSGSDDLTTITESSIASTIKQYARAAYKSGAALARGLLDNLSKVGPYLANMLETAGLDVGDSVLETLRSGFSGISFSGMGDSLKEAFRYASVNISEVISGGTAWVIKFTQDIQGGLLNAWTSFTEYLSSFDLGGVSDFFSAKNFASEITTFGFLLAAAIGGAISLIWTGPLFTFGLIKALSVAWIAGTKAILGADLGGSSISKFIFGLVSGIMDATAQILDAFFKRDLPKAVEGVAEKLPSLSSSAAFSPGKFLLLLGGLALVFTKGRDFLKQAALAVVKAPTSVTQLGVQKGLLMAQERELVKSRKQLAELPAKVGRELARATSNRNRTVDVLSRTRGADGQRLGVAKAIRLSQDKQLQSTADLTSRQARLARSALNLNNQLATAAKNQSNLSDTTRHLTSREQRLTRAFENSSAQFNETTSKIRQGATTAAVGVGSALGGVVGFQLGAEISRGMTNSPEWLKVSVMMGTAIAGQMVGALAGNVLVLSISKAFSLGGLAFSRVFALTVGKLFPMVALQGLFAKFLAGLATQFAAVKASSAGQSFLGVLKKSGIVILIITAIYTVMSIFSDAIEAKTKVITKMVDDAIAPVEKLFDDLMTSIKELPTTLSKAGTELGDNIIASVSTYFDNFILELKGVAKKFGFGDDEASTPVFPPTPKAPEESEAGQPRWFRGWNNKAKNDEKKKTSAADPDLIQFKAGVAVMLGNSGKKDDLSGGAEASVLDQVKDVGGTSIAWLIKNMSVAWEHIKEFIIDSTTDKTALSYRVENAGSTSDGADMIAKSLSTIDGFAKITGESIKGLSAIDLSNVLESAEQYAKLKGNFEKLDPGLFKDKAKELMDNLARDIQKSLTESLGEDSSKIFTKAIPSSFKEQFTDVKAVFGKLGVTFEEFGKLSGAARKDLFTSAKNFKTMKADIEKVDLANATDEMKKKLQEDAIALEVGIRQATLQFAESLGSVRSISKVLAPLMTSIGVTISDVSADMLGRKGLFKVKRIATTLEGTLTALGKAAMDISPKMRAILRKGAVRLAENIQIILADAAADSMVGNAGLSDKLSRRGISLSVKSIDLMSTASRVMFQNSIKALDGLREDMLNASSEEGRKIAADAYYALQDGLQREAAKSAITFQDKARTAGEGFATSISAGLKSGLTSLIKGETDVKSFMTTALDTFTSGVIDTFMDGLFTSLDDGAGGGILGKLGENIFKTGGKVGGENIAFTPYETDTKALQTRIAAATEGLLNRAGGATGGFGSDLSSGISSIFGGTGTLPGVDNMDGSEFGFENMGLTADESLSINNVLMKNDLDISKGLTGTLNQGFSGVLGGLTQLAGGAIGGTGGAILGAAMSAARIIFAASGGKIRGPGTGTSDSVPAMLSNGEFVINAGATSKNLALLTAINSGKVGKFAAGGLVGVPTNMDATSAANSNSADGSSQQIININITGDISKQTRKEVLEMSPLIANMVHADFREKRIV